MKNSLHIYVLTSFLVLPYFAYCQETQSDIYNERNYIEVSRGAWNSYFAVTFEDSNDRNRKIRFLYADSSRNQSFYCKYFFLGDTMNGPFFVYSFGRLTIKGNMRMNKLDGEKLTLHSDSTLSSREFYKDGRKIGIWEEYSSYGSLTRRTYYNNHGKFIKREIFDQRGNLSRTEYEEKKY